MIIQLISSGQNEQRSDSSRLSAGRFGAVTSLQRLQKLPAEETQIKKNKIKKMNKSEFRSLLKSAEYDFERRFDERWAVEWMQENW